MQVSSSFIRFFFFSIELRRNLAESAQRKKATGHPVAFFRTFHRRTTFLKVRFCKQRPGFSLCLSLSPEQFPIPVGTFLRTLS
ncbi:hypothetical protein FKM52_18310 [Mixta tenebrionis]|uniref:Uncharacterized protein n=1 Tax=Mixta tenebrionis TaxID=2562439 RepID=A0A506V3Z9_9GAMM|nr:hypothetical protein FKM52_18310 [Mixta tenebrionis]